MANPVPAGSQVSAGSYRCANCGHELRVRSTENLPPCPSCHYGQYESVREGDSAEPESRSGAEGGPGSETAPAPISSRARARS
jgi:predicted  nucleic acid-binding Zn-ribbon protein